jgi:cytochrome c oxidase cbb3-type subunit I
VNSDLPSPAPPFARVVALHSLGWLVAANLVGVWLGVGLLWPALGNALAPLTWGRWAPLHMNWQLYGWCALPMVGALLVWCFDPTAGKAGRHAQIALGAWTTALALGGIAWLAGIVSGKLFLDWHGWARLLLPLAMLVLWVLLASHTRAQWKRLPLGGRALRTAVLAMLLFVPPILFWATGRAMYHPINPDSGGATGAAVLGSSLGIVTIFVLVPQFLGLAVARNLRPFIGALMASWLVFAFLDRGNVSHHTPVAIVALATLFIWVPLLPMFWRCYVWPTAAKPWLIAAAAWWTLLVVTGWLSFLPGISEAFKFTHALVGHAHLAMAGLITCVNSAVLVVIVRRPAPPGVFWLWQGGCALYIASMLVLGWGEVESLAELFRGEAWTQALLALRLFGGVAMTAASLRWLWACVQASPRVNLMPGAATPQPMGRSDRGDDAKVGNVPTP